MMVKKKRKKKQEEQNKIWQELENYNGTYVHSATKVYIRLTNFRNFFNQSVFVENLDLNPRFKDSLLHWLKNF